MWCFSKRKQCFCTRHASSENITLCVVQPYIVPHISYCEVSSVGGAGVLISHNERLVIATAEECVFVSETALESKT